MIHQPSFRFVATLAGLLLVNSATRSAWGDDEHTKAEADAKASIFKVTCLGVSVIPSRRLSYSVGFQVVETIHDAFADEKKEYASGGQKRSTQAKRGSPVDDRIGARIYSHADLVNEEGSITRLLKFLGQDVQRGARNEEFDINSETTYTMTVTHAESLSQVRWTLEDADGIRVTLLPYKNSR